MEHFNPILLFPAGIVTFYAATTAARILADMFLSSKGKQYDTDRNTREMTKWIYMTCFVIFAATVLFSYKFTKSLEFGADDLVILAVALVGAFVFSALALRHYKKAIVM